MTFDILRPAPAYLAAYLDACRVSWGHVHDDYILHNPAEFPRWKETVFTEYRNREKGIGLPPGFVPSVTFWLIGPQGAGAAPAECLGALNIRLRLSEKLRRYGGNAGFFIRPDRRGCGLGSELVRRLPALFRELKIEDEILLTCFLANKPSAALLRKLPGARLEEETVELDGRPVPVLRARLSTAGR